MRIGVQLRTLFGITASVLSSLLIASGLPSQAQALPEFDRCVRSRTLSVGSGDQDWYSTLAPFENHDSSRTQVFPEACTLQELTLGNPGQLITRIAPGTYPTAGLLVTRDRDELFLYGGEAGQEGGYVAKINAKTLVEQWRTTVQDTSPTNQWSYPGGLGVHANGYVYAVFGSRLTKIDPETGSPEILDLPEREDAGGAVYNGFVITPDGLIITKSMERGDCPDDSIFGLRCVRDNKLPATIAVIDPDSLAVLTQIQTPEPVIGRVATVRRDGVDYIYCPGIDHFFRYRLVKGELSLDTDWGMVPYRTGNQQPGTGAGILGDFAVIITNFLTATEPMTVVAVHQSDSSIVHTFQPFADFVSPVSGNPEKAILDAANNRIYPHDYFVGQLAALELDPEDGFSMVWRTPHRSGSFATLVGTPDNREIVLPDVSWGQGEQIVWRDPNTGQERLRSPFVGTTFSTYVAPGFNGKFYFINLSQQLIELTPVSRW